MVEHSKLDTHLRNAKYFLQEKAFREAHSACIEALKIAPDSADAHYYLGVLTAQHNNHLKACELFTRAIDLDTQQARYYAHKAQSMTILGQQTEAKSLADKAAHLPLNDAFIADTLGVIYSRAGFHEQAVPFFKKAVALNPRPANFHYNLAASLQFLGDFKLAHSAYQQTIKRDPAHFRAWSSLIGLNTQTPKANYKDRLLSLFETHSDNQDAALHFGHAIAKTLEDLGQYSESFAWLEKAKAKKRASSRAHSFDYDGMFNAAKNTYSPSFKPDAPHTYSQAAPIFIFGMPRTGTTLVDRILSSHPDVVSAGELNMFATLVKEASKTKSNLVMDTETLTRAKDQSMRNVGNDYICNTVELARGGKRMTDKMPFNFFFAGLIHRALPNARMIVLRRGALDSCLSNYRQLFTVQHSYYHYTYDLMETAQFYKDFDRLMKHWRTVLPANRFLEIQYEDIVFDQENQTRRLLEFCDLDWNEACMRFHENTAPVSTASSVQVRKPLYSGSIGRWKRYGNKLDGLQHALGALVDG